MPNDTNTYYWSVLLALTTVFFWSLSAPGADYVHQEANYLGLAFVRMACGALVFGVWLWYDWDDTKDSVTSLLENDHKSPYWFIAILVLFGIFLLVYDLTFFFSIQEGPSVPANIINYLWPLFLPAFGSFVFRRSDASFGLFEMGALSLAFSGAALIAGGSADSLLAGGIRFTYIVAFVAAVSAGVYMNLLPIAEEYVNSTPLIYFVAVLVALLAEAGIVLATGLHVEISTQSLPILLLFGLSTFGLAQLAWGKALVLGEHVLISSLSYLTPILSTIFLSVFVGAPLTESVAFGAVLIIAAQVMLNDTFRHMTSLAGALIAIFLSSLYLYIDPAILGSSSSVSQISSLVGTIFAILTGFMLERVWATNRMQDKKMNRINETLSQLITDIERSDRSAEDVERVYEETYELIKSISDLNYGRSSDKRGKLIKKVRDQSENLKREIRTIRSPDDESIETVEAELQNLDTAISNWLLMSQKRVSRGELAILALLGAATMLTLVISVGDEFLSNLIVIGVNGVIVFSVLKIRDYDYDRSVGSTKILLEQRIATQIDKPLYFPHEEFTHTSEIYEIMERDDPVQVGSGGRDGSDSRPQTVSDLDVRTTVRTGVLSLALAAIVLILVLLYMQLV